MFPFVLTVAILAAEAVVLPLSRSSQTLPSMQDVSRRPLVPTFGHRSKNLIGKSVPFVRGDVVKHHVHHQSPRSYSTKTGSDAEQSIMVGSDLSSSFELVDQMRSDMKRLVDEYRFVAGEGGNEKMLDEETYEKAKYVYVEILKSLMDRATVVLDMKQWIAREKERGGDVSLAETQLQQKVRLTQQDFNQVASMKPKKRKSD